MLPWNKLSISYSYWSAEVVAAKVATPVAPKSLIDKIWNEDTKVITASFHQSNPNHPFHYMFNYDFTHTKK